MVDQRITELTAATTLAGTEVLPVVQGGATKQATVDQILAGAAAAAPYTFRDTFTRANNATSMGTIEEPAGGAFTWEVMTGSSSGWGINGNAAYHPGGDYGIVYVEAAASAATRMVVSAGADEEFWLMFRIIDSSNYYRFGHPSSDQTYVVQKIEANALGTISASIEIGFPEAADGDELMIVCRDNDSVDAWVNGVRVWRGGDTEWMNAYRIGMGAGSSTPDLRISEWESVPLGGGVSPVQQPSIATLGQDISAGYIEAEVQAISSKVDALITALRAAGVLRAP